MNYAASGASAALRHASAASPLQQLAASFARRDGAVLLARRAAPMLSSCTGCSQRNKFLEIHLLSRDIRTLFHSSAVNRTSPRRRESNRNSPKKQNSPVRAAAPAPTASRVGRKFIYPISPAEVKQIFGAGVSEEEGNSLLRHIHLRRVEGSLVDKGLVPEWKSPVSHDGLQRGLDFLRERYPLDEEYNAEVWAEQQLSKLESIYVKRGVKLGMLKRIEPEEGGKLAGAADDVDDRTATSVLEQWRQDNLAKRKKLEEEQVVSGEAQKNQELALAKQVKREELAQQREEKRLARHARWAERGMVTSKETSPPEMSIAQRLVPSTLVVATALVACYFLSEYYTPPATADRLFPNTAPSVATIGVIIGLNFAVLVAWKVIPGLWRPLNKYFTTVPAMPYAISMIGNPWSHRTVMHWTANMAGLLFYGIPLHEDIGRGNFLALFLGGAAFGSLTSLWYHVLRRKFAHYHHGASGGIWAVMAAWAVISYSKPQKPPETWSFIFDVSRWAGLVFQILGHFTPGVMSQLDVLTHVGGAVSGLMGGYVLNERSEAGSDGSDGSAGSDGLDGSKGSESSEMEQSSSKQEKDQDREWA